jgi:CPA2 family monovalent cation:H+ antiporter-2
METPEVLIELGAVLLGLAVLARVAAKLSIPTIPLYLLAGLAFGKGGILPLVTTEQFITIGAEIGLILLLLMLGLEYSASELVRTLRTTTKPGLIDLVLNFVPGFAAGLLLGWGALAAVFLGGVTYVSSSGVAARVMQDIPGMGASERGFVLSILIVEDLAMAVYLPVVAALVIGGITLGGLLSAAIAIGAVAALIVIALHFDVGISRLIFSRSDETMLLTILGLAILVAGIAESIEVSAAVAALLVGIMLSGPVSHAAHALLSPLRDLFAAMFFAFIGLSVDPSSVPGALLPAAALALVTGATKFLSVWLSAPGLNATSKRRAASVLLARGEFSIVIAGLGVASAVHPRLGPVAVAYVLIMVVAGPLIARFGSPRSAPEPAVTT